MSIFRRHIVCMYVCDIIKSLRIYVYIRGLNFENYQLVDLNNVVFNSLVIGVIEFSYCKQNQ